MGLEKLSHLIYIHRKIAKLFKAKAINRFLDGSEELLISELYLHLSF